MSRLRAVAVVEARMTSSRLPGKVLLPAAGQPMLQILVDRLQRAVGLDAIVIATTTNRTDDPIEALGRRLEVGVFRGSEEDVLGRVAGALREAKADVCVEVTGDCPLADPRIVTEALVEYLKTKDEHPYVSNSDPHRAVPAGLDVQVFSAEALYKLDALTEDPLDREHVSYGFYRPESANAWRPRFIAHASARGGEGAWLSLDYREDYALIRALHEDLAARRTDYGAAEILDWIRAHPQLHEPCLRLRRTALP